MYLKEKMFWNIPKEWQTLFAGALQSEQVQNIKIWLINEILAFYNVN